MAPTCYRHPNRETGVSCSNCGKPICPECMTPTPVGMRCPECASQRTKVVRNAGAPAGFEGAPATYILIAINVLAFLAEIGTGSGGLSGASGSVYAHYALRGVNVSEGEWYRLITGGFLHAGLLHIGFNMFALYIVGRVLEPAIGTPRFLFLYFASLLALDLIGQRVVLRLWGLCGNPHKLLINRLYFRRCRRPASRRNFLRN